MKPNDVRDYAVLQTTVLILNQSRLKTNKQYFIMNVDKTTCPLKSYLYKVYRYLWSLKYLNKSTSVVKFEACCVYCLGLALTNGVVIATATWNGVLTLTCELWHWQKEKQGEFKCLKIINEHPLRLRTAVAQRCKTTSTQNQKHKKKSGNSTHV